MTREAMTTKACHDDRTRLNTLGIPWTYRLVSCGLRINACQNRRILLVMQEIAISGRRGTHSAPD
jgi:hypothetical protein